VEHIQAELAHVEPIIKEYSVRSVCDHGCGNGDLLRCLAERFPGHLELTGVDRFSTMCESHRPDEIPGVRLVDRDGVEYGQLSAEPGFDLVLSCFALHHYSLPVAELKGLSRMLRPGGRLFLADWLFGGQEPAQVVKDLLSLTEEAYAAVSGRYHRHHYTVPEAVELVEAAGFDSIDSSEERMKETEEDRRGYTEERVRMLRDRMATPGEGLPGLLVGMRREQLERVVGLIGEHGLDWSRYFVLTGRKPTA
jgi:ubiquinone/menaquinone biosynthesis C-methylase UbiE